MVLVLEDSPLPLQKAPPKNTINELPSIFKESWGPGLTLMKSVGTHLEQALDLIPPSDSNKKTRSRVVKREQMGNALWATLLGAGPSDDVELRSVEIDGGRKMINVTYKGAAGTRSISALNDNEHIYVSAEEGRFVREVSFSNSPGGEITQLDDIRIRYEKPGSSKIEMNYMHRYDAEGNRTPINQLRENWILPMAEVGIDPTIRTSLFTKNLK